MNIENLKIAYRDFRIDMKALPLGSNRTEVKKRMSGFLEMIKEKSGQETVNKIVCKKK